MASIYISAAHKSSGKTTVTLGICRALKRRGITVQPFKKGPDYIDPIWHGQASGNACYNLDYHMMTNDEINQLFIEQSADSDISIIEGNKGLYDGMDLEGSDSNAALAKQLKVPVVLVIDTLGMTRGIAPLIQGYCAFDSSVAIAAIILNKVGGPRHESKLRDVLARYTKIPVIGAIYKNDQLAILERHLGLIPANESDGAESRIDSIADIIESQVDLDAFISVANKAKEITTVRDSTTIAEVHDGAGLRIGIANDKAFGFYYQQDRDSLRNSAAEIISLDMTKNVLPDLDGLIIGGGFPEFFIEELSENRRMIEGLQTSIEQGLPVYAECGGLMYLCRTIVWNELSGRMVGVLPADAVMTRKPVGRGYAILKNQTVTSSNEAADTYFGHEFHHSHLENLADGLNFAFKVERGHGIDGVNDGYIYKNVLASYCHRRGTGKSGWITPFLQKAREYSRAH